MNVTVRVTKGHIEAGKPGKCLDCPVALAVADTLRYETLVSVCPFWIELTLAGELVRVHPPPAVSMFIVAFDSGELVAPFDFTLTIPGR